MIIQKKKKTSDRCHGETLQLERDANSCAGDSLVINQSDSMLAQSRQNCPLYFIYFQGLERDWITRNGQPNSSVAEKKEGKERLNETCRG